jgi:hypothetical protein
MATSFPDPRDNRRHGYDEFTVEPTRVPTDGTHGRSFGVPLSAQGTSTNKKALREL